MTELKDIIGLTIKDASVGNDRMKIVFDNGKILTIFINSSLNYTTMHIMGHPVIVDEKLNVGEWKFTKDIK